MEVRVQGVLPNGVTAKDLVLYIIGKLTTEGGTGYVIEYTGDCIRGFGMEQRMTLATALLGEPTILLLDEPMSALDAKLREAMQVELKHLHKQIGLTFIMVTHDQTEALVAIDVNSGRTRSDTHDFEEIALVTNLEAVPEVARQMRLRDFGGIIVVDFIDMMKRGNIKKVEEAFAAELARDRARSKVGRISQFGLLEMTRERGGPGIIKKLFSNCTRCRGEGKIRTVQSRSASILRRLQASSVRVICRLAP